MIYSETRKKNKDSMQSPSLTTSSSKKEGSGAERGRQQPISTSASFFFEFGQFDFGQFRLRPILTSANFDFGQFLDEFLDHKGWGPKGGGPKPSKSGAPKRVEAQNFALFFPLPPQFSFFSPSLVDPFVEFWWCLKRQGAQMCTFGVLGLSCEAPAAPKPPKEGRKYEKFFQSHSAWIVLGLSCETPEAAGVSHDNQSPNGHILGSGDSKKPTKIQRKDPQEREKRMKTVSKKREKNEILGVQREGGAEGGPTEGLGFGGFRFRAKVFGDKNRNRTKRK